MLTLLRERVCKSKRGEYKNEYLCHCGKITQTRATVVKSGKVKSCGCYNREVLKMRNTKHGLLKGNRRLYFVWNSMKQRCLNPNNKEYKYYGGRGISVCDEWIKFEQFYNWAKENGYQDNLTIDRIDNDKYYCPENCRWVTHEVNCQNRRRNLGHNKVLEIREKFKNGAGVSSISKEYGIEESSIRRIKNRETYKNI